jgi:hypothetical protein
MRTASICPTCPTYTNSVCVLYDGPYLENLDVAPLTDLEEIIQKIDAFIGSLPQETKEYVVSFDQIFGDPDVQIFKNTLSGPIVWTRTGTGDYEGVLNGAFPAGKTFIPQNIYNYIPEDKRLVVNRLNDNTITIECRRLSDGSPIDFSAVGLPLKIEIYP